MASENASGGDAGISTTTIFDVATLDPEVVKRRAAGLIERAAWSREQLLSFQGEQLREVLQHAVAHSSWYRDRIGALVARGAALAEFPVMNKLMLMENFDRIVTDPRLTRAMVEAHVGSSRAGLLLLDAYRVMATGGTTGVRGIFVYDTDAWEIAVANLRRLQHLLGLPAGLKYLGIGAPSPVHLSNRFFAEGRVGHRDAPCLSVTTPMPEVVAALNAFQPEVLSSYPSFLRRLTEEQRCGRLHISPGTVRSTAEAMSPDIRERVLAAWNVVVTNNYGSTEFGIIAMECKHRRGLHLAEDLLIMEIVDAENRPVPAGTQGAKVLVTPLFNKTLPLIRYELTDLLTVLPGDCPCGSPFRRIDDIEGRSEEILSVWTASGLQVKVHAARLWFHLVRIPGIQQYQFVQLPKGIRVLIAATAEADAEAVRRAVEQVARSALDDLGATGGHIEVEIVAKIDLVGDAAKERRVVSSASAVSASPAPISPASTSMGES